MTTSVTCSILSSSQIRVYLSAYGIIDDNNDYYIKSVFTVTKSPSSRTATIKYEAIIGNVPQNYSMLIEIIHGMSGNITTDYTNLQYSSSELSGSPSLLIPAKSFVAQYNPNGTLMLNMLNMINVFNNSVITTSKTVSANLSTVSELNIDPLYSDSFIEILNVSGFSSLSGIDYVTKSSDITIQYSANSDYNTCIGSSSYVGIKLVDKDDSSNYEIYKISNITDSDGTVSINLSTIAAFSSIQMDRWKVYAYAIRTDGTTTGEDETYIGINILKPFIYGTPNVNLNVVNSSEYSYNLTESLSVKTLYTFDSQSIRLFINSIVCIGSLSKYRIEIIEYVNNAEITKYTFSVNPNDINSINIGTHYMFTEDGQYRYKFKIIPMYSVSDGQSFSTPYFKLLRYPELSVTGTYENNSLIPVNETTITQSILGLCNKGYKSMFNGNSILSMSYSTIPSSIGSNISANIVVYKYGSIQEYAIGTISQQDISSMLSGDSVDLNISTILGNSPYASLLNIINGTTSDIIYSLIKFTIASPEVGTVIFYQYVGRVMFCPIRQYVFSEVNDYGNPDHVYYAINHSSFYVTDTGGIDNNNNAQYGIITQLKVSVINNLTQEEVYSNLHVGSTPMISIPKSSLESNINYTVRIIPVYTELDVGIAYELYPEIYLNRSLKLSVDSPGLPLILYPVPGNYPSFASLQDQICLYILFRLPELIDGSGSASPDDIVYSDIRVSVNDGDWNLYSAIPTKFSSNSLKYKSNMVVEINSKSMDIGECQIPNVYVMKIQVYQSFNGIAEWGEIATIAVNGQVIRPSDDRELDYENNGIITVAQFNEMADKVKGLCKSYNPNHIINYESAVSGDVIRTSDFTEMHQAISELPSIINNWAGEGTYSVQDIEEFNPTSLSKIMGDNSNSLNYIEEGYKWIVLFCNAWEYTPENEFIWIEEDGNITIIMYIGSRSIVLVPPTIDSKPVTKLEATSFNYSDVQTIVLPDSIIEIS